MAEIKHLRRAPIVEAMIDVRVEARPDFRGDSFNTIRELVAREYPVVEERRGITFQFALGGPPSQQIQQLNADGLFFRANEGKNIAQFRGDGFTFNRLAPYTGWDEILPRALGLLATYLTAAAPKAITRVATRYINRLKLPSRHFEEFLSTPPRGVPGIPGAATSFMEVAVGTDDSGATVNFTQALDASSPDSGSPFVLMDIDAFNADSFDPSVDEVKARLTVLHELKNRVFFGALTDPGARLFA